MAFVYRWFVVILVSIHHFYIDASTYSVSTYGAFPNDNIDDSNATQWAIYAAAFNGPNNIVLFQSGTYAFSTPIYIYNAVRLTIKGQGMQQTLLLGHTPTMIFSIGSCQGLILTSFAIDFVALPFTAGYVVNVNANYLDVQVVPPHRTDIGLQVGAILRYDSTLMRPAIGPQAYEIYQTPPSNANTSLVSNGTLRLPLASASQFAVGNAIIARYSFTTHAIYGQDITDFTAQSITIYTSWYMGIFTLRARRLNMIDYHVTPRTGRWMSTAADCMHFGDSREYVNVFNSTCEAQGDDGLNIQAFYFAVTQIINSTTMTVQESNWADVLNVGVGTRLEFSSSQAPFTVYATATLAAASVNGASTQLYIFTSPINASVGDRLCVADTPALTINNFTVANNRARGMLLETRNISVTQSLFNRTSGPAVLFQPSLYWYEGPGTRNVMLSQNVYINCNEGIVQEKGMITFLPYPVQLVPVLFDVQVISSTFQIGQYSQNMIQCDNGANVIINGNYINTNSSMPLISICNSQNINAMNNSLANNQSTMNTSFIYDTTSPCVPNLSSQINLPLSAFNSTFPPPVTASGTGVVINGGQTSALSTRANTAATLAVSHLYIWDTDFILPSCSMLLCYIYLAL